MNTDNASRQQNKVFAHHLWLKVERDHPQQIFILGLTGVDKWLKVELPSLIEISEIRDVIRSHYKSCHDGAVPCFGKVLGYYYHYEPDKCIEYDIEGVAVGTLNETPKHYGQRATLTVEGKAFPFRIE